VDVPATDDRALAWAFRLANNFFEHAKAALLGRIPRTEGPTTGFFLREAARAQVLTGPIFCDHEMPERDQQDLAVGLVACCTDASAVATVGGLWDAFRCAACGCGRGTDESPCERCGASAVPVCQNRYRHWLLCCHLRVRGSDETWSWTSRALHDGRRRILAWDDDMWGTPWKTIPGTRHDSPWILKRWMRPHFALNYPLLQDFLGRQPEPGLVAATRRTETRASTHFRPLRVDPVRLKKALHAVNVSAFRTKKTRLAPGF
jgi:hypothetical protein